MNELSTERAIEALYTVRAYYASLTAGYPKGKDRRGIGDVMCSEIANSCLMAIKALEQTELNSSYNSIKTELAQTRWIPVSERLPEHKGDYLVTFKLLFTYPVEVCYFDGQAWDKGQYDAVLAWMPLPKPYKGESEE